MVKLVSPKYSGTTTSDLVKVKVKELLYLWTIQLPHEKKIAEAYEMLKSQGLISSDPDYVKSSVFPVSATPRKVDMDNADSQKLQRLLHSKDPADIEAANRIIKGMVRKDEEKMEMISKRVTLFETVNTNMKLLTEMMNNYNVSDPLETLELITDLGDACEKLRPNLYRIAAQLEDDDEAIGEVLLLSDELNRVIDRYRSFSGGSSVSGLTTGASAAAACSADLLDIDQDQPTAQMLSKTEPSSNAVDDLLENGNVFGLDIKTHPLDPLSKNFNQPSPEKPGEINGKPDPHPLSDQTIIPFSPDKTRPPVTGLNSLDLLGESLFTEILPGQQSASQSKKNSKLPMKELMRLKSEPPVVKDLTAELLISPPAAPSPTNNSPPSTSTTVSSHVNQNLVNIPKIETASSPCSKEINLTDITLEMSEIQPDSSLPPLNLQNPEAGVAVTAHFTKNKRSEGLAVLVVTLANHQQTEISEILFKPVVSKGFKVKSLAVSTSSLAPLASVFSPPATATVIVLIASTSNTSCPCSLSFFLSFNTDADSVSHIGDHKPLPDTLWKPDTA